MLEKDDYGIDTVVEGKLKIALARCPICKSRYRLLPADIVPFKLYSLPVIELCVCLYNRGDLSLRQVAWDQLYGEHTPEHTTLHGWSEGIGAWWLGRAMGEVAFSVPATRIVAELEMRFSPKQSLHSIPVWINPQRYRSPGRCERLQACKRFEIICARCCRPKLVGNLSNSTVSSSAGAIGSALGLKPGFAARRLNTLIGRICDYG
jgi:hypothetical protein